MALESFVTVPSYDAETLNTEEHRLAEEIGDILASAFISKVEVNVVRRIVEYRCFALDERQDFDEKGTSDKFSRLIELSRQFERCETFFTEEVSINSTTTWRWATGRTRPSKFLGKTLASQLRALLIVCIEDDLHNIAMIEQKAATA